MDRNDIKRELLAYCRPDGWKRIVLGAVFLLGAAVGLVTDMKPVSALIFFFIVGVSLVYLGISAYKDFFSSVKCLEDTHTVPDIYTDFSQSAGVIGDRLRIGKCYLFGKNTGNIIEYREIGRIYQYIHRTNLKEDRRSLKVRIKYGKDITLCKLPLNGTADADVVRIVTLIKHVNPAVEVGYKK